MLALVTVTTQDSAARLRDGAAVHRYVTRVCFKTGPPLLVGTELELLVAFGDRPGEVVPLDLLRALLGAAGPTPCGSFLTFEPGGQLELSSPALPGASATHRALATDLAHVRTALRGSGLVLLPTAVDPFRLPYRQLHHPRYDAMEAYFAATGASQGPVMMTSTAATQVNLDVGATPAEAATRWRLLHDLGPVMVAAFANSPQHAGRRTGWKSTRQRVWQSLDAAAVHPPLGEDPAAAFTDYALDAPLMMRPREGADWAVPPGPTFRDWVEGRLQAQLGDAPTEADLAYHLTTLFPPVRPRGWFEVRYLDSLPDPWWAAPAAVLSALLDDPVASDAATEAAAPVAGRWEDAARHGLDDTALATAALACFTAAVDALPRLDADPGLTALVAEFTDRYVAQGRSPADDPFTLEAP